MNASHRIYLLAALLFLAGVTVQVFFAGMAVVAGQWGWRGHINLGHSLALPLLAMTITAFSGKPPASVKRPTLLLLGIYILQADVLIFLRASAPMLSALHPVLALADFALGLLLVSRVRALAREPVMLSAAEAAQIG